MNPIRSFSITVFFPTIIVALSIPMSLGEKMPHGIQTLIDKRKGAIERIDKVFVQELEKAKTAYLKAGDLEKANLAAELIKNTSGSGNGEVFSLDGEWRYRIDGKVDGKIFNVVRRFKGNNMIDEGGIERRWISENDGMRIDYGSRFEKLVLDPENPDVINGANNLGMSFTYTRIK